MSDINMGSPGPSPLLEPDRDAIEIFADALFRHAGTQGFASLRAFFEGDSSRPFRISPISLAGGLPFLIECAEDDARRAAQDPKPVVFAPPIAVFGNKDRAGEKDIALGLALSVELDEHPQRARERLEELLGQATVVVRSGGVWTDPATGEVHDKVHCHWRLAKPAQGKDELGKLKEARDIAASLVGGDPTNRPVCHPIRWPGSWHRKATPRLCEIEAADPDREIELDAALATLTAAAPALGTGNGQADPDPGGSAGDWGELIGNIVAGKELHASLTPLSMKMLRAGMMDAAAVRLLRGILDASSAARDARWRARWNDIPRAVSSARQKLEEKAEETISTLHWHGDPDVQAERRWLIENLLPETGAAVLAGQFGVYKSFTAFDLAAAVINGTAFVDYPVVRRGGVLFVAAEGGDEVAIRLQAVVEHKCGSQARVPFAWTTACPSLLDPTAVDVLAALAREAHDRMTAQFGVPLALIIVDTVTAAITFNKAGDENDAAVMGTVMKRLAALAERTGTLTLAIDHLGKAPETGVRGSSSKEGGAHTVLAILADRSLAGEITNMRLAARKVRSGPSGREVPFRVRVVDMGHDRNGRTLSSLVLDWSPDKPAAAARPQDTGGWTKALQPLRRTLMNVLATDQATMQRPFADGPLVRAVDVEIVRGEFYRMQLAEGDAEAKQAAKQKAFRRAITEAQRRELVGLCEIGRTTFIWLAKPGAEPAAPAQDA